MSFTNVVKALVIPALAGAALAAPLFGSAPASAATCQPDPLNGVCVAATNYTVKTTVSKLAVQRLPQTGNISKYVAGGSAVSVICQVNNGGTADGLASRTWDALVGGGWVYNPYVNGVATGTRVCGTAGPESTYTVAAYPWQTQDGWVNDGHGYYEGECVSFAAWAVRTDGRAHTKFIDFMGNAYQWTGAYVDSTPHAGDVAQWDANFHGAGSSGHVAYVRSVNPDGSITVDEYNWGNFHRLNTRTFVPGSAYSASRYLHF